MGGRAYLGPSTHRKNLSTSNSSAIINYELVSCGSLTYRFGGHVDSCQSPSADGTYDCYSIFLRLSRFITMFLGRVHLISSLYAMLISAITVLIAFQKLLFVARDFGALYNGTFESNLKLLLDSLSYNTATTGFYNTTVGEGLSQIYGQALCRGDASSAACEGCVSNASQEIMKLYTAEDALIWYELCQVRYSFQDFFSKMVYTGKYPDSDYQEKLASDPARFYTCLMYLMKNISNEAAYVNTTQMFAVGKINKSVSQTIYGLVQCTRDMSDKDCYSCLESALADLRACCYTREGGTVVSRTCNVRYELYRFFNGSTTSTLSYPASTGEKLKSIGNYHIKAATDDFPSSKKLGQGGFGTVYKLSGLLSDGKEVAVKRLSRNLARSREFKNENLVRLLGCSIEGDEKLLVTNSDKRAQLGWCTCVSTIHGIARGLVYLHEDSRLRIIHRDLKPSNVLLDHEMVAKISDFGMAKIFCKKQSSANTRRVVGTYGYMALEYAMGGLFSVKSYVFSFGVILLEIIGGKRSSRFYLTEHAQPLPAYAWKLWTQGRELELVDPSLVKSGSTTEIVRRIHIGLLCVQEYPGDRPTMSEIVTLCEVKKELSGVTG
ncbi:hypothetical protein EUGRSUZ_E03719 [Eucalyptus grandis]|uniref:Uncharacterized protein n=1 Tax=Eucalyptus grandis TaxID=71139 RepID=A0ACC3KZU2_EUCGR|nr:hypothetical protein EUGRSUZ_E03719 [Eucalyptus grandis]